MASISTIDLLSRLNDLSVRVVTVPVLSKILNTENANTIYKTIERLEKYNLIKKVLKGKYILADSNMSDFEKANIILSPSYISLESALTYYGILPQFTYSITSVTPQKSRKYQVDNKEYEYTKIQNGIYHDFVKIENFLIASPEKALIDLAYLASKKIRKIEFSDLELSIINWEMFNQIASKISYQPFQNYIKLNRIQK